MSKLKYFDGTNWNIVNGQITGDTLPIGAIVPFGGWDAPTGWLICDGTLLNKTTYPELFNAIGYSFGGEDGGATFGLPDLRGRVPVGQKDSDSDFDGMGVKGGEKTHTLTIDEIPSHKHGISYNLEGVSGGTLGNNIFGKQNVGGNWENNSNNTGGGQAHNILQPYQTVNYIIKVKQSAGVIANVSGAYSESETDVYNCDYINKALGWKLVQDNVSAGTNVSLSSINYNELWCVIRNTEDTGTAVQINIPKADLTTTTKTYRTGFYYNSGYNAGVKVDAKTTQISFNDFYVNGSAIGSGRMAVYYK